MRKLFLLTGLYKYSFITSHHGITVFLCENGGGVGGGGGRGGRDIGQMVN